MELDALATFVRVHEHGSFTAAAHDLNIQQPAVSKQIKRLEMQLQAPLFHRSTRGLTPTEAGEALYAHAVALLEQVRQAEVAVRGVQAAPAGRLRVAMPTSFGTAVVMRHLPAFSQQYPNVQLQMLLDNRFIDLVAEGVDVAIRIGTLQDSALRATRLAGSPRIAVATPDMAAALQLSHPRELTNAPCVAYSGLRTGLRWGFDNESVSVSVAVHPGWVCNHSDGVLAGVLAGRGVGVLPLWALGETLATGQLVRVLPEWAPQHLDVYAVSPPHRFVPRKVTAFIEHCRDAFAPATWNKRRGQDI